MCEASDCEGSIRDGAGFQLAHGSALHNALPSLVTRVSMQGFGNVGSWAARLIHLQGGKVLAVSDRSGGLYNERGLDIPALVTHMRAQPPFGGHMSSFPGGAHLLTDPCMPIRDLADMLLDTLSL